MALVFKRGVPIPATVPAPSRSGEPYSCASYRLRVDSHYKPSPPTPLPEKKKRTFRLGGPPLTPDPEPSPARPSMDFSEQDVDVFGEEYDGAEAEAEGGGGASSGSSSPSSSSSSSAAASSSSSSGASSGRSSSPTAGGGDEDGADDGDGGE